MDKKGLIRDVLAKLNKISDDSWIDIIERYELDLSEHELRKRGYGMKMYAEALEDDTMSNEQLIEIKKQKQQLSDLRTSVQRDIRKLARVEDFADKIIDECKNIPNFILEDVPKIEFYEKDKTSILLLSDIHYDSREDIEIKFNKVIKSTIEKCKFNQVNKLIICLAGDLINNEFRTTSRIENRSSVSTQITGVSALISNGILELAKNIPYICVAIVLGNHDRSIALYNEAMSTDNYLPIIKELIKLRLNNIHNVAFLDNVPNDDRFCLFNEKEKVYCLYHGDGIKGNIQNKAIPTIEAFLNKSIDTLLLGHFHQIKDFQYYSKRVVVNGSITNEFDYSKKGLLNTPEYQRLLMLDDSGDIECIYDIRL